MRVADFRRYHAGDQHDSGAQPALLRYFAEDVCEMQQEKDYIFTWPTRAMAFTVTRAGAALPRCWAFLIRIGLLAYFRVIFNARHMKLR